MIHCPTKEMVGEFFTKLLQGLPYFVHTNAILGINERAMSIYVKAYNQYRALVKSIVKPYSMIGQHGCMDVDNGIEAVVAVIVWSGL